MTMKRTHPEATGHDIKKNIDDNYYPKKQSQEQPQDLFQYERNRQRSMRKIKRMRTRRIR